MNDELKDMLPAKGASLVGFAGLGSLPPAANGGWPVGLVIAVALNQDIITRLPPGPQLDYTREIPPGQRPSGQPGPGGRRMADQPGLPGPGRDGVTTGLLGDRQTFEKALAESKSFTDNFENIISSVLEVERLAEYEDEDEYGHTNLYSTLPAHLQQCLTGDFHPVWPRMRSGPKPTPRAG